jgi:N-methylhydantoinase B/oxoprolinase/acetone carboxylase alpha subunit
MTIDPVTLELVKNAVESVVDEMALTLIRTAYSMNLKSSNDLSSAYCSLDGELLAQGFTLPMQASSILWCLGSKGGGTSPELVAAVSSAVGWV